MTNFTDSLREKKPELDKWFSLRPLLDGCMRKEENEHSIEARINSFIGDIEEYENKSLTDIDKVNKKINDVEKAFKLLNEYYKLLKKTRGLTFIHNKNNCNHKIEKFVLAILSNKFIVIASYNDNDKVNDIALTKNSCEALKKDSKLSVDIDFGFNEDNLDAIKNAFLEAFIKIEELRNKLKPIQEKFIREIKIKETAKEVGYIILPTDEELKD